MSKRALDSDKAGFDPDEDKDYVDYVPVKVPTRISHYELVGNSGLDKTDSI